MDRKELTLSLEILETEITAKQCHFCAIVIYFQTLSHKSGCDDKILCFVKDLSAFILSIWTYSI